MKRRPGFTLIEIIGVFLAEMVVLAISVGMIVLVFETNTKSQRIEPIRIAATELSRQFRNDVHRAKNIEFAEETLKVVCPDGESIVYSYCKSDIPGKSCVLRESSSGNATKSSAMEKYAVPDRTTIWYDKGTGEYAGLVAMNLWSPPVDSKGQVLVPMPEKNAFKPFTREAPPMEKLDLRYSGNWRTIIAKQPRNRRRFHRPARSGRHGLATIVTLVVLVVVGMFLAISSRNIVLEKDEAKKSLRKIQADQLANDFAVIAKTTQTEPAATIPKRFFQNSADLKIETKKSGETFFVDAEFVGDKLPARYGYSVTVQTNISPETPKP